MNRVALQEPSRTKTTFLPAPGVLQRKCECGKGTSADGECQACGKQKNSLQRKTESGATLLSNSPLGIQSKLSIGASDDPLEKEADRIADQVLAAPTRAAASSAALRIQRFEHHVGDGVTTVPASVDRVLASPGIPLEVTLRHDMEQRFGHDFSQVRIHAGAVAEQSAQDVNAQAYTVGHNMVFASERFVPGMQTGRRLIAHELTHVVQQGGASAVLQRQPAASANPAATDAAQPSREESNDASTCPGWFDDPQSLSKRAAEHYVRNDLTPPSQAEVEKVDCEKPIANGNYACMVKFSDGLVIRVIVRKQDIVVGVPPFTTMTPPPDRPMCFYNYACPQDDLILTKRECRSSK